MSRVLKFFILWISKIGELLVWFSPVDNFKLYFFYNGRVHDVGNQSDVWDHFIVKEDPDKAKCIYCGGILKCNQGSSFMIAHALRFQKRLKIEEVSSPSLVKFDQERSEIALAKMIVGMELPYRHVEHKPATPDFLNSKMTLSTTFTYMGFAFVKTNSNKKWIKYGEKTRK